MLVWRTGIERPTKRREWEKVYEPLLSGTRKSANLKKWRNARGECARINLANPSRRVDCKNIGVRDNSTVCYARGNSVSKFDEGSASRRRRLRPAINFVFFYFLFYAYIVRAVHVVGGTCCILNRARIKFPAKRINRSGRSVFLLVLLYFFRPAANDDVR